MDKTLIVEVNHIRNEPREHVKLELKKRLLEFIENNFDDIPIVQDEVYSYTRTETDYVRSHIRIKFMGGDK